jgi:hypothetical protein
MAVAAGEHHQRRAAADHRVGDARTVEGIAEPDALSEGGHAYAVTP